MFPLSRDCACEWLPGCEDKVQHWREYVPSKGGVEVYIYPK